MKRRIVKLVTDSKALILMDQVIFSGTSFATTLFLARLLSPTDFGLYSTLVLVMYFLSGMISALVIQPFQVNYASESNKKKYSNFSIVFQLILITFISLFLWFISFIKFDLIHSMKESIVPIIVLSAGFLLQDYFRRLMITIGSIRTLLIADALISVAQLTTVFIQLLIGASDFKQILLAQSLSYLPLLFILIYHFRNFSISAQTMFSFGQKHMLQGKWLLMTNIIQWWSGNFIIVASGLLIGPIALGAFRLVQSLFGVLNVLLQAFENYSIPKAATLLCESAQSAQTYLQNISRKVAFLFGGILLILFAFADQFIILAGGEQYAQFGFIIRGMVILYILIFIGYPIRIGIRIMMMDKIFFTGYCFTLIFNLLTFKYFLSQWSISGVLTGLILSQIILIIYWQYTLYKKQFRLWKLSI